MWFAFCVSFCFGRILCDLTECDFGLRVGFVVWG